MIRRALLKLVTLAGQKLQGSLNGRTKESQNLQSYGFFSSPPSNSEIVMLPFYDSYYGIAYKKSLIPSLKQNEVSCGNFVIGSLIKFDEDGNIEIIAKDNCNITITGDCNITCENANITATIQADIIAPAINLTGNVIVSGTLTSGAISSGAIVSSGTLTGTDAILGGSTYSGHIHSGVTTGASNTGGIV